MSIPLRTSFRLRDQLAFAIFLIAFVPMVLSGWYLFNQEKSQQLERNTERLESIANTLAPALTQYFSLHRDALTSAARQLQANGCQTALCTSAALQALVSTHRFMRTALATDADGVIVAAAGMSGYVESIEKAIEERTSVADRDYFVDTKKTLRPRISEVFRGRGLGNNLLVAVTTPLVDADGQFEGILQASLDLRQFNGFASLLRSDSKLGFDVYDNRGNLALSSEPGAFETSSPVGQTSLAQMLDHLAPGARAPDVVSARVPELDWTVLLRDEKATAMAAAGLNQLRWTLLMAGFAITLLTAFLANAIASYLAQPLEYLARRLREIEGTGHLVPIEDSHSVVNFFEYELIRDEVNLLIARLRKAFAHESSASLALKSSLAERDAHLSRNTDELRAALHTAQLAVAARDEMLANTSHEIRTPLNGIIGTCELLLRAPLLKNERGQVETVLRCAEGLLTLINDILDLTRANTGHLELSDVAFSVQREIDSVIDAMSPIAAQRDLKLRVKHSHSLAPEYRGDALRFRQVLMNLVGNGLKFTEQGSVTVHSEPIAGVGVAVTVTDTGIGMTAAQLNNIFTPFVQVDTSSTRRFQGSGLGLAISRRLVELMDGKITVESKDGKGSTFRIELPLSVSVSGLTSEHESEHEIGESPKLRVLVVDDVDVNRELLIDQLRSLDCTGESVASGELALERVRAKSFDLILLDCQMPGMDGYETARRMRALSLDYPLKIIAVTANALPTEKQRCLDAGMDDLATKPLRLASLERLLSEVAAELNRERGVDNASSAPSLFEH